MRVVASRVAWLIGPLLALAATAAACGGAEDAGEFILLHGRKVDPTCRFLADELIVRFKDDNPTDEVRAILSAHGADRVQEYLDLKGAWVLNVDPGKRDRLRKALEGNPAVEYVEPNYLLTIGGINPCASPIASPEGP